MTEWILQESEEECVVYKTKFIRCGDCTHRQGDYCHCGDSYAFLRFVFPYDYCRYATDVEETDDDLDS